MVALGYEGCFRNFHRHPLAAHLSEEFGADLCRAGLDSAHGDGRAESRGWSAAGHSADLSCARHQPLSRRPSRPRYRRSKACIAWWAPVRDYGAAAWARIKVALWRGQGDDTVLGGHVLDHIIPLALGGAARDASNLQLQTLADGKRKDRIEIKLQCLVCTGQVALGEAQRAIGSDWRVAYARWAGQKCCRPGRRGTPLVAVDAAATGAVVPSAGASQ